MNNLFFHTDEHEDQNMIKLEVNLDDTTGEWLGYVIDLLFESGANDVYYTPIYMKKNRPGVLLNVLCDKKYLDKIKQIIFKETTTLGLRYYFLNVHRLERRFSKLHTPWGEITVKLGIYQGDVVQCAPEYEDCKRIARENKVALKDVYQFVWKNI